MQQEIAQQIYPVIVKKLPSETSFSIEELTRLIQLPKLKKEGIDYTLSCGPLSKIFRKKPQEVAIELCQELLLKGLNAPLQNAEAANVFINFAVDKSKEVQQIIESILFEQENYGKDKSGEGKTVCVEYSSPNIAKHFAVYHLLSTLIGNVISNLYASRNWKVMRLNHIGDWGTNIGYLIAAIKHEVGLEAFNKMYEELSPEEFLQRMQHEYVQINDKKSQFTKEKPKEENPYQRMAKQVFVELEQGEKDARDVFDKIRERSLDVFNQLYSKLEVSFDCLDGEFSYSDTMPKYLAEFERRGVVEESEGARVIVLDQLPKKLKPDAPCMVVKSDGGTTYQLRDLSAILYRKEFYKFDRLLYVVASQQINHFKQVFGAVRKAGFDWIEQVEHLPFGMMSIRGVIGSTRKGNVVSATELFQVVESHIRAIMEKNNEENAKWNKENNKETDADSKPVLTPSEIEENVHKVVLGSIVYQNIYTNRIKDKEFDMERATNFAGDSGPYLQMVVPKMNRILMKHKQRNKTPLPEKPKFSLLTHPSEIDLATQLGQFSKMIDKALASHEPSMLTSYLMDLAGAAHKFHHDCRVLQAESEDLRDARLVLTKAISIVMSNGLRILGIPIPSKM